MLDCEARKLVELLRESGAVSEKDIIHAELLSQIGCPHFNRLVRVVNTVLLDRERKRKQMDYPTISEGDR